jgi:diguanylate cyclase (GGDEF)-like protein
MPFPAPTRSNLAGDSLHAGRESDAAALRRENGILKQKNEQLIRRLSNVSRRALAADRLAHQDSLTGLPNRLVLIKRLQRALAVAHRQRSSLSLLFVDLDGFKRVNDRFGHRTGDLLLTVVGARIAACVRFDDIACRYGGDEFVVLLGNDEDSSVAERTARSIRESIGRRYSIEGQRLNITASIGIATYPGDGLSYDVLLGRADDAMYRDKAARKGPGGPPGGPPDQG